MNEDKCDNCKQWYMGCDLYGDFRRDCIKNNYKWFKTKIDKFIKE